MRWLMADEMGRDEVDRDEVGQSPRAPFLLIALCVNLFRLSFQPDLDH
jgi:hypothetical protein